MVRGWSACALSLACCTAGALEPSDIFKIASRSVVVVMAGGETPGQGSGVTVAPDVVATNCHVVPRGAPIRVRTSSGETRAAQLIGRAEDRDLCLIRAVKLGTEVIKIAERNPTPGDRVYAIGSPMGLDLTISEGLLSGVRAIPQGNVLQTSAPISPGSSGGGLFNVNGELLGLTTLMFTGGQNLNFAVPAGWISESFGPNFARLDPTQQDFIAELRDAVQSGMSSSEGSRERLTPKFANEAAKVRYIQWLAVMGDRLRAFGPDMSVREEFLEIVWYESNRAGIEPAVILALMESVSSLRKYKISANGSRGYLQVPADWVVRIGDGDASKLFHTQQNLRYGCVILRHYLDLERGDLRRALARYLAPTGASATPDAVLAKRTKWAYP